MPPYSGKTNPAAKPDASGHFDHLADTDSHEFKAAHAYAALRKVLDVWEGYSGERVQWFFAGDYTHLEVIPSVNWENGQAGYGFIELGFGLAGNKDKRPFSLNFDVLAHEMGHYKKKHIRQSLILGILQTGLMLFLLAHFITYQGLFDAFYMSQQSIYAGMIFFAMLYAPIDFLVGILMQVLSRKNETVADQFAAETTKDPVSMVDALKKLSVHNLSNLTPHPFYVFLNYSHPPVLKRIQSLSN